MKCVIAISVLLVLLTGCADQEVFETVTDEVVQPVMAEPRRTVVDLPENAVAPVLETVGEQMYLCGDYDILIETAISGDLNATVRKLSGYDPEELTMLQTRQGDTDRYEFVWVSAGETGDRLGRAVILDDGDYHYCMTVLRDDTPEVSQISWDDVFGSFQLS